MRVVLRSDSHAWELGFGVSLVGTDPACDVRLPPESKAPPFAGAVVRWLEHGAVVGIGNPSPWRSEGKPIRTIEVNLTRLRSRLVNGPAPAERGLDTWIGEFRLILSVEDVPSPARADEFTPADLEAVLRAATAHATEHLARPGGRESEGSLLRLLARMTGSREAALTTGPGLPGTVMLRSQTGRFVPMSVSLSWPAAAPATFAPDAVAASLSRTLDDGFELARAGAATGDPPASIRASIVLPKMRQWISSYGYLGPDDFDHLGLAKGTFRDPQVLVSTIGGRIELVDLSEPGGLMVDGRPVRRARVGPGSEVRICNVPVHFERSGDETQDHEIPSRVFTTLAGLADPISQMARLGFVLHSLRDRGRRRVACLLAAACGARAGGAAVVRRSGGPASPLRAAPAVFRWLGKSLWVRELSACAVLRTAIDLACSQGGELVTRDVTNDERILGDPTVPEDLVAPLIGPLAVLGSPGGSLLVVWRPPWEEKFVPSELNLVRAIARVMEGDGLARQDDLGLFRGRPARPAPRGPATLRVGRLAFPLGPVTVLGRDDKADVQMPLDPSASGRHALIVRDGNGHRLLDMRSFHGLSLDGKRVSETSLVPGRLFDVGSSTFAFQSAGEAAVEPEAGAVYLAEDTPALPDSELLDEALELIEIGRLLAGATDPVRRSEILAAGFAPRLGAEIHVIEHDLKACRSRTLASGGGSAVPEAFLSGFIEVLRRALSTGAPQWTSERPTCLVVPVPEPPGDRATLVLVRRATGLEPAELARTRAVAVLIARLVRPGAEHGGEIPCDVPVLKLADREVAVTGPMWIGRSSECQLVLDDSAVSRRHALVVPGDPGHPSLWVVDFCSDAGLCFREQKVDRLEVHDGGRFSICGHEITVEIPTVLPGPQTGILAHGPALVLIGESIADGASAYDRVAGCLLESLDAARVVFAGASGRKVLGQACVAGLEDRRHGEGFLGHLSVERLVERCRSSGAPLADSLDPEKIYRRASGGSIQMVLPLRERSGLAVCISRRPDDDRVLVVGSLRPVGVAFRQTDLAACVAVARTITS